jgi:putative ABC transport system permease protein
VLKTWWKDKWGEGVAFRETLWLALDTLRTHKLRSFLTLLGVILAVFTLVAVMSVIEGLNRYIGEKIANLGSNAFVVTRFGIITNLDEFMKAQKRPPLRYEDYVALRDNMETAERVAAVLSRGADVRYGNELLEDVGVAGITPNYLDIYSIGLAQGRFLDEVDDEHRSPVCFLGTDVADRFFASVDPVGKSVRVGPQVYQVVGVAKPRGTVFGISRDNYVLIPLGTYMKTWYGPTESLVFLVQARNPELIDTAQDEVRMILRGRRHLRYNDPDNFGIIASSTITGLFERLTGKVFMIAVGLTSVFLVVGGIVIMNIMLASVVERTHEIGIRKSVGAKRRHIVMQFLIESAVLAALGGFFGVVLAMGVSALVSATTPLPIVTPLRAVIIALTLSTSVGLFFGIYPAVRASRLDPIEALRVEN